MSTYEITESKSGSQTWFYVAGENLKQLADAIENANLAGVYYEDGDTQIKFMTGNKRDTGDVRAIIAGFEKPVIQHDEKPAQPKKRYITRVSDAQRNGLNHGKSWVCSESNIDQHSLPPHWGGEMICYVYPE